MGREDPAEEAFLRIQGEWFVWAVSAAEDEAPALDRIVKTAKALLDSGFPAASVVAAFTALEVLGAKVIVGSLFKGLTWPFDELSDFLADSIFGRNGKLQNLRKLLALAGWKGVLSDDHWVRLEGTQKLRNTIAHEGIEVPKEIAEKSLTVIKQALDELLETLTGSPLDDWALRPHTSAHGGPNSRA